MFCPPRPLEKDARSQALYPDFAGQSEFLKICTENLKCWNRGLDEHSGVRSPAYCFDSDRAGTSI